MREAIFKRLRREVLVEASAWGHYEWAFHSRFGAWDYPNWGLKRFVDAHCRANEDFRRTRVSARHSSAGGSSWVPSATTRPKRPTSSSISAASRWPMTRRPRSREFRWTANRPTCGRTNTWPCWAATSGCDWPAAARRRPGETQDGTGRLPPGRGRRRLGRIPSHRLPGPQGHRLADGSDAWTVTTAMRPSRSRYGSRLCTLSTRSTIPTDWFLPIAMAPAPSPWKMLPPTSSLK